METVDAQNIRPVMALPDQTFYQKYDVSVLMQGTTMPDCPPYTYGIARFPGGNDYGDVPVSDQYGPARLSDNVVATWGWNFQSGGGRLDITKPAWGFSLEYNYFHNPKGVYKRGVEGHWKFQDANGLEHRPITMWLPWDGGSGAGLNLDVDTLRFCRFDPTLPDALRMSWDFSENNLTQIHFHQPTQLRVSGNNSPFIRFQTANGQDYYADWYLDNQDRLLAGTPITQQGPAVKPDPALGALYSIVCSQMAASKYVARWTWNNVVNGSVNAIYIAGQCSGEMLEERANYGVGSVVYCARSWSGDAITRWCRQSGKSWSAGLDYSDGEAWKLSRSVTVGTNDYLRADDVGLAFCVPTKHKVYTYPAVPDPTQCAPGTVIYVVASDGAGFAASDGVAWRRLALLGSAIS